MTEAPKAGRQSYPALSRLIVAVTLVAVTIVGALLFANLAIGRRSALLAEEEALLSLSASVAAETDGIFQEIHLAFLTLERWMSKHPATDPRLDPETLGLVDGFREASGGLVDLCLATSKGELFDLSSAGRDNGVSVADRDYFKAQAPGGKRGFFIGQTEWNGLSRSWVIPVSWPLSDKAGTWGGPRRPPRPPDPQRAPRTLQAPVGWDHRPPRRLGTSHGPCPLRSRLPRDQDRDPLGRRDEAPQRP